MPTSEDETVPVRVKDLEEWAGWTEGTPWMTEKISAYLPKPRLVTVDLDRLRAIAEAGNTYRDLCYYLTELEKEA